MVYYQLTFHVQQLLHNVTIEMNIKVASSVILFFLSEFFHLHNCEILSDPSNAASQRPNPVNDTRKLLDINDGRLIHYLLFFVD